MMNFRLRAKDEPELNLIPFIDVLLVVLIFLMLSTTYSKFNQIELRLPVADSQALQDNQTHQVILLVAADGSYTVNSVPVPERSVEGLAQAITVAARGSHKDTAPNTGQDTAKDTVLILSADANSKHQSVVSAMEAGRRAGLNQIRIVTQSSGTASGQALRGSSAAPPAPATPSVPAIATPPAKAAAP